MNKTKNYLKVAGLSALMSLLPSKFTPAIAQNLKQNTEEKAINNEFSKYMQNRDNENFFKQPMFRSMGSVIDGEGVLTDEEEARLEDLIQKIEREINMKIEFITTDQVENGFLEEFCADYGNGTGLGTSKFHDNGVVFVMNKSKHKSGIVFGDRTQFVLGNGDSKKIRKASGEKFYAGDYLGYLEAVVNKIPEELTAMDRENMKDDAEQADRELTAEEKKEKEELLWNLLYAILFGSGTVGGLVILKKRKDEYYELVEEYNNYASGFMRIGEIEELDKKSKAIIKRLSQNEKYTNIVKEILYLSDASKENLENIYNMQKGEKYTGGFADFMKSGTNKIKNKIAEIESATINFQSWVRDLENNLGEIIKIYDKINESSFIYNGIRRFKLLDKVVIDQANEYEKEGFIIGKLDKSINDASAGIDSIFEKLKSERYYESTNFLDESILSFENISKISKYQNDNHDQLILRMSYYADKAKYISQNIVDDNSFANASDIYGDLMTICPKELISAKISLDDIKNNINLHPKLVERINKIYETKDLEKLAKAMNMYIDNAKDTKERISNSSKMLSEQIKAKSDCESKIKEISKVDDIYYYDDELSTLNNKYGSLSNKIRGDKNDWVSLLVDVKQLVSDYSNLKSKAASKKRNDHQKVIDDANEAARAKAAAEDRKDDDNDRYGGGSFSTGSGSEGDI